MDETSPNRTTATHRYLFFIRATVEEVWQAIITPEMSAQYYYGARVETTAEVGSRFVYHSPTGNEPWGDETVLEAEPPHRIATTWRSLYNPEFAAEPASRVVWEIDAHPHGISLLTLTHDQLDTSPKTAADVTGPDGWPMLLSGLKTLLETGQPLLRADEFAQLIPDDI